MNYKLLLFTILSVAAMVSIWGINTVIGVMWGWALVIIYAIVGVINLGKNNKE